MLVLEGSVCMTPPEPLPLEGPPFQGIGKGSPDQTCVLRITMLSDQLTLSLPPAGLQFLTSSVVPFIPKLAGFMLV